MPIDIKGTYFRNGHAKFEVGNDLVMHPFDADGMLSAVTMENGKAVFRNRFILTSGYKREKKAKKILYRGAFGTGRSGGMLANIFDTKIKNVANTNVIYWGEKLLALWEGGLPHLMEPDSLRTIREYTIGGLLKKQKGDTFSAHPRVDAKTGRLINFSANQSPSKCELTIYEFEPNLKVNRQVKFEVPGFVFFHDFLVTDNYYIFNQAPIKFEALPFLLGQKGPAECIEYDSKSPATLYLIPRDGSPAQVVKVDPHFNFHFANAYEENKNIIFDVVYCNTMQLGKNDEKKRPIWLEIDYGKDVPYSTLMRYTLTPKGESWSYSKKQLSPTQLDFPSINPKVSCSKHRYVYASCGTDPNASSPVQGLIKIDTESGTETKWIPNNYEYLGELIFINKEGENSNEDSGYLVTYLFNGKTKESEFVIFDAENVSKGPISRQKLPTNVPFALHGSFAQGLTFDADAIVRRHKACLTLDSKSWNDMEGGFSGLGLKYLIE